MREVAAPVDAAEFSALMQPFAPFASKIAVAVSGGSDSMALALCAQRWKQASLIAFIVEHGLRAESAAEAHNVLQSLQSMGIVAEILPWTHQDIGSRVEEKARAARYALLTEACRRHGVTELLMAHHRDDQAETVLMRLSKFSGIDGLAAMPLERNHEGLRLIRPFLCVPKDRLVATCQRANVAFVTDPTNASDQFTRSRWRQIMPLLAEQGLTAQKLCAFAEAARDIKRDLDRKTHALLVSSARVEIGGNVWFDRKALQAAPRALALRALASALRYVANDSYPPEYTFLIALWEMVRGPAAETTRTLYGCIASLSAQKLNLLREPSAAEDEAPLSPGQTVLWDHRWRVTLRSEMSGTLRALRFPPHEILDKLQPHLRRDVPQGRVRATLPALWQGDRLIAIPSFNAESPLKMAYHSHFPIECAPSAD